MNPAQGQLFKEYDPIRYGEGRYRNSLILPRYVQQKTLDYRLEDEKFENAYKIILRWIDLEKKGKLEKMKEKSLQGEFVGDIFGKALGYTPFSDNKDEWNLEHEFGVNGGFADGALGFFEKDKKNPKAVIELKGPTVNLDRDRFSGRTAVGQCWDYLNLLPDCPWGIVSNYVSIRLYHRDFTPHSYLLFVLNELNQEEKFRQFYYIMEKGGLISIDDKKPRTQILLDLTSERQREVGDDLYNSYHNNRVNLIHHLTKSPHNKDLEKAIYITQKLIDRIIFVAFCEDRELLPKNSISKAYSQLPPFSQVTNPKWQNFLNLFKSIDKGNKKHDISPYNGGLFKTDSEVDNLQLNDKWTDFFNNVSKYDFRDEVSVEVLGHLFEKSVNDIEKIRKGGLFEEEIELDKPRMQKSAERKRHGIYYTPPEFTMFIVHKTVGEVINDKFNKIEKKLGIAIEENKETPNKKAAKYWSDCLKTLKEIRIVDPACGSGAFLIAAYNLLEEKYKEVIDNLAFHEKKKQDNLAIQIPDFILSKNLYGVDLSPQAVEITQLSLWIRSAQKGKSLANLSENIICGNSLVDDHNVHPRAFKWNDAFPDIFERKEPGFDCVIGNPPWERMNIKKREFFASAAPHVLEETSASKSRKLIAELDKKNPELYERFTNFKKEVDRVINFIKSSNKYPLTSKRDVNTYAVFAELSLNIVSSKGRIGLLVPTGIATDNTYKYFFDKLMESKTLISLYDFENRKKIFPDVHGSFKFCILIIGGQGINSELANCMFFNHQLEDLFLKNRSISLSVADIKLLNPNTKTCPIFRTNRDAQITKAIYQKVPILIDENRKSIGNPWNVKYMLMFHQSFDSEHFKDADELLKRKYRLKGNVWSKGSKKYIPLYEAKMIQAYDHRAASVKFDKKKWTRQGQTIKTTLVQHRNPEYVVQPRWWIEEKKVESVISKYEFYHSIVFKNVTSPTNHRTMIGTIIPWSGVVHSAPLMIAGKNHAISLVVCLLGNLNSYIYDYVCRQKIGGINLSYYIINQLPVLLPEDYDQSCPWNKDKTLKDWVSERVLKLTCTSNDMIPFAEESDFKPKVWKWKPEERAEIMAQLDACYLILYGVNRDDAEYILSTFGGINEIDQDLFDGLSTFDRIMKYYDKYKSI